MYIRVEVHVRHAPHQTLVYENVNYQLKFFQLKSKINGDLAISPFRQRLTVHLRPDGNNQIVEGVDLNRRLAMYYDAVKGYLEISVNVIPQRTDDHLLRLVVYESRELADFEEDDEPLQIVEVDEDDTVSTLKKILLEDGFAEGFTCCCDCGTDKNGRVIVEEVDDAFLASYYFQDGDTVLLIYPPDSSDSDPPDDDSDPHDDYSDPQDNDSDPQDNDSDPHDDDSDPPDDDSDPPDDDSDPPDDDSDPPPADYSLEARLKEEDLALNLYSSVDSQEGIMLGGEEEEDVMLNSDPNSQEGVIEDDNRNVCNGHHGGERLSSRDADAEDEGLCGPGTACNKGEALELANVTDATPANVDIISSNSGEVKISLSCNYPQVIEPQAPRPLALDGMGDFHGTTTQPIEEVLASPSDETEKTVEPKNSFQMKGI